MRFLPLIYVIGIDGIITSNFMEKFMSANSFALR